MTLLEEIKSTVVEIKMEDLDGFKENLTVIAARAGMGKTFSCLEATAGELDKGHSVLFFSMEETPIRLMKMAEVAGKAKSFAEGKIEFGHHQMKVGIFSIIEEMRKKAISKEGLDFVVVDNFVTATGMHISSLKESVLDYNLNLLGHAAKELDCKVLVSLQLARTAK